MKTVGKYEIESTIDHSQYWQGAGLAFSDFEDIGTGIGNTEAEGAEDALEILAQNDWDTDSIDVSEANTDTEACDGNDECGEECEHHWFVTIRVMEDAS